MVEKRHVPPTARPRKDVPAAGAGALAGAAGGTALTAAGRPTPTPEARAAARRRRWLQAAGASLVCHVLVVPYGLTRLLLDRPQEIEIAYLEEAPPENADTQPPPEALPPEPEKPPEPDKKKPEQPPVPDEPPPEPDKRADKPPEPEKKKEKEPEPLEVKPIPHLKMVDQEQFPDEQDNADAKYLAQKNHRAEKETRAEDTNLVLQQAGEQMASEPSNAGDKIGEKQKKVAELQDQAGDPKRIPTGAPPGLEAPATLPQPAVAPLAMRSDAQKTPQSTSAERQLDPDGLAVSKAAPGPLDQKTQGKESVAQGTQGAQSASPFRLNHHDYDRVVGFDVSEKERRDAALAVRSSGVGHWDRLMQKQALLRASLENYTPNVRPGNQSELGTRKHPFAAFIAAMHRQIHKFWGEGYLAALDARNDRTYDMSLVTAVEISLNDDGSLSGMIIARSSGNGVFDAAALDSVMSASPFPSPPGAIKSKDGKIYITWRFHRDDRQCATDFVDAHILTTPPKPGAGPSLPLKPAAPRLATTEPAGPAGAGSGAGGFAGGGRPGGLPGGGAGGTRLFPSAAAGAGTGAPPANVPNMPNTSELLGLKPPTGAAGAPGGAGAGAGPGGKRTAPPKPTTVPDDAREAAERWLTAYQKSDLRWLAASSALPFTAGGKTVAEDKTQIRAFYTDMLSEGVPRSDRVTYYTQSQIAKRLGRLPRGGDEEDMTFAWIELSGEDLILIMQPADRGWSVVGIDRPTSAGK